MSSEVFVLGAGGYIGEGVALAFRRHGFVVHGLVRNSSKSVQLLRNEISPIIGTVEQPELYRDILTRCSIIVDAVGFGQTSDLFLKEVQNAAQRRNEKDSCEPLYKPLFIFTSGIMTYGNARETGLIDENVRPAPMFPDMEERRQYENKILSMREKNFLPVVVRPGFVYGGHGGPIGEMFFGVKSDGDLVLYGRPDKRWSWVHVDDLGEGYVTIATSPLSVVANQQFNLAALGDNPTYQELRVAFAKAAGWDDTKYKVVIKEISKDEVRVLNWEANVIINPMKAYRLGWTPRHLGLLSEIQTYHRSWKASKP